MKAKIGISLLALFAVIMAGCGGRPEATFEISGAPDPLLYGGSCSTPILTFTVTGPGEGLKINSIIVAYQLFDGSGKKIHEATHNLYPVPDAPPVTYDTFKTIYIPDSGGVPAAPDEPVVDFGEGYIVFAATVFAKLLTPAPSGPEETYYFTSTKKIPVLPCRPAVIETIEQSPGDELIIITREPPPETPTFTPMPTKKPKQDSGSGGPPAPPSCSAEPNNPSCVP